MIARSGEYAKSTPETRPTVAMAVKAMTTAARRA